MKQMNRFFPLGEFIACKGNPPESKNKFIVAKRPVSLEATTVN
jgi:hypothetical protein